MIGACLKVYTLRPTTSEWSSSKIFVIKGGAKSCTGTGQTHCVSGIGGVGDGDGDGLGGRGKGRGAGGGPRRDEMAGFIGCCHAGDIGEG